MMTTSPRMRARDKEMFLLKQLSTRLDPSSEEPNTQPPTPMAAPAKPSVSDPSKSASKNLLLVKVIVRGLVKACIEEGINTAENPQKFGVLDALVEEYRPKYPTLTKQMVTDSIARQMKPQQNEGDEQKAGDNNAEKKSSPSTDKADETDGYHDVKVSRCMEIVDEELFKYHEKIEALRKRRVSAASEPSKKRKSTGTDGTGSPKKPRGRPKGSGTRTCYYNKATPESHLVSEITERYIKERQKMDRLPKGVFELIVQQTKKDLGMEDNNLSLNKIRKRVTWNYINRPEHEKKNDKAYRTTAKKKDLEEEVYERYSRMKKANENRGKLKPGALEQIIEGVRLEMGMKDDKLNINTLESKIQSRFTKENPDYAEELFRSWTKEDLRRRQLLMNEIVDRYVKIKAGTDSKKLADGVLDKIIEQTKNDLGIHDFEVPKASIRGRLNRKSLQVMTLGSSSPYNAIDEALVETINNWLGQGISVTRAQGLEFANTLLKGKNLGFDEDGNEILLDAKWWRNFLERNKGKIVCS